MGRGPAADRRGELRLAAASGLMALTGRPGGPPLAPPPGLVARLEELTRRLREQAAALGAGVAARWAPIVTGRAALLGLRRRGQESASATCRLLRARDGWVAVNLARPEDVEAVEAITEGRSGADAWSALTRFAAESSSTELVGRARLLGVPAARLGERASGVELPWCAVDVHLLWPPAVAPRLVGLQVVDLSSMWAGPLAAKLLADAGAEVTKVESTTRPDGARSVPAFYRSLHPEGQRELRIDFDSTSGRQELRTLLARADVVIESSRPRALEQLRASPWDVPPRPGRVWVSITGHGREGPQGNWVAFGDDAAVAGGLVVWEHEDLPLFCGDAIADPVTGMVAALAAMQALARGGGVVLDVALARIAAALAPSSAARECPAAAAERGGDGSWQLRLDGATVPVRLPGAARQAQGYTARVSSCRPPAGLETVALEVGEGVAEVTLDRPDVLNAFDERMQDELAAIWRYVRHDDDVRAVVLTGRGDQAFCAGIDRKDIPLERDYDPYTYEDPGKRIGPKSAGVWKPVVAAVNGIACGGAFYLLGESDIIVAAEHATFFDPHVTYAMTAAFEPILLAGRMAFADLARMVLVGAHERMSARTAREAGLVSEVVAFAELLDTARRLAAIIAAQPPASVQASLRTLWAARSLPHHEAVALGNVFLQLGTTSQALRQGQEIFADQPRPPWRLR